MRQTVVGTLGVMIVMVGVAAGATLEQARRETDQARKDLAEIDRQILAGGQALAKIQRELSVAQGWRNEWPRLINGARASAAGFKEQIAGAQAAIGPAKSAADEANKALRPTQDLVRLCDQRLDTSKQMVGQVADRAWRGFVADDPAARAADGRLSAARAKYDAAAASAIEALAKTPAYQQALAGAGRREEEVKALRAEDAPPAKLAEASTEWMKAKGEVEAMKQAALERDPAATAARAELRAAEAELAAARARFERDVLPAHADYAAARRQVEADTTSLATARQEIKVVQANASAAEARVRDITTSESAARRSLAKADQDVARWTREMNQSDAEMARWEDREKRAREDLKKLQDARDRAAKVLKEKEAAEDRARRGK